MEITATKKVYFILAIFILVFRMYSQTIVNTETVTFHGTTDTADYMPIQINVDGKIILSGNKKISATQYDASTDAQFSNAATSWVNSFNVSTEKCFVTASTHDLAGNITILVV